MAYTYDDVTKAAKAAGVTLDDNDIALAQKYPDYGLSLVSLKRDAGNATTQEQRLLATEAMNELRNNYGSYWTGDAGNRSYASAYGSTINDLLDRAKNFSYDPETDQNYSAYKKQYLREGDRATQNALASAAAATGGIPSSYAATAATQAGNYYAGQLADKVPELRAQALSELLQNLQNYQAQDNTYYARYLDQVNEEYQRERDAVNDAQQEWNNAWQIYVQTGQITGPLKGVISAASAAAGGGAGGTNGLNWRGGTWGADGKFHLKGGSSSGSGTNGTGTAGNNRTAAAGAGALGLQTSTMPF